MRQSSVGDDIVTLDVTAMTPSIRLASRSATVQGRSHRWALLRSALEHVRAFDCAIAQI